MQKWLFNREMVIYLIWLYNKWPVGPFSRSFPTMTCRLLFPTWLLPTMTLATICRNGSEPFERTLTVLTACLYHLSSSILHSFTFLFSLSFTFFHPHFPSYTFHFSISVTFIHLYLFSFTFILIHSPSFTFIHTHFTSFILHKPSGFTRIHLHLPPLAFTHLACSAGVFFERSICSRKRHVETSRGEEEMGQVKGSGEGAGRGRGERRENACSKTLWKWETPPN